MKIANCFFLTALFLLAAQLLSAGEMTIPPEKIHAGDTITVKYQPDERFVSFNDLKAFFYLYSEEKPMPDAYEISLYYDSTTQKCFGNYVVPEKTVFGMVKVDGEDTFYNVLDDNHGEFWDFIVYGEDGKPVRGANLKAGVSWLGGMPKNIDRTVDYNKAARLLEKETKLYPENIHARIGYTSLQFDLKKITQETFQAQMKEYAGSDYDTDNESAVRAVSRALRAINKNDEAEQLDYKFAQEHPESKLAEEQLLSQLSTAETMDAFSNMAKKFLMKYPNSPNREKVYSAIATSYLQVNKYEELKKLLNSMDNVPATAFNQLAVTVVKEEKMMKGSTKKQRLEEAKAIYTLRLEDVIFNDDYGEKNKQLKPDYFTTTEWKNDRKVMRATIAQSSAEIFIEDGNKDKELKLYEKALELMSYRAQIPLYEKIVEMYIELNKKFEAFQTLEKAILNSQTNTKMLAKYKTLFKEFRPEEAENFNKALDSLEHAAKNRRFENLRYNTLDKGEIHGAFKTLDDRIFDFEDLKGKVVIINFWATWCSPCQALLPTVEELFFKYHDSTDVVIMAIDVWEKSGNPEDAIYDFLENKEYEFPIFFDPNDIIPRKAGVTGLPTNIYLDKKGRIRFIEQGFSNEIQFRNDAMDKIEFLLKRAD